MKKTIPLILLFIYLFLFPAQALLGSKRLILEGGAQEIQLAKGEKEYLNVRDGLTNLPLFNGVTFYSDNTMVATVGQHSGIIRANGYGKAHIYAVSKNGDAGKILVCVSSTGKKTFAPLIVLLSFTFLGLILWIIIKKNGIC